MIRVRVFASVGLLLASVSLGQVSMPPQRPWASVVVVPQLNSWSTSSRVVTPGTAVSITSVDVDIDIVEQVARTRMDIHLKNPLGSRQEAELLVPVPDGVIVHKLDFQGSGSESAAQLLPRDEARSVYESLVGRVRDPAILEFSGSSFVRTSVFPVEPHGTQQIRLVYEQLLAAEGDRVDYVIPRSESLDYRVPWKISARIAAKTPIAAVYSSSHDLQTIERSTQAVRVAITPTAGTEPGSFRMSYLLQREGFSASLLAYPDPSIGGGYFLLLAGVPKPADSLQKSTPMPREVTLVIDRSGSMSGNKIVQVRAAARQIVSGLLEGESFNVIAYNDLIQPFAPKPLPVNAENVRRACDYINHLTAEGGTNLHDALVEALRSAPAPGSLPLVLFLTDGLPTVGQTRETVIRDLASKGNPYHRRVFTIGVGVDVNAPLLDKIASESRATSTIILPNENVETRVAGVFERLTGPILADPALEAVGPDGQPCVCDVLPARLPDIFEHDQLVVVGKYHDAAIMSLKLRGSYLGSPRTFEINFNMDRASTRNAFVSRLWASRRIAVLIDAIRQMGADEAPAAVGASPWNSALSSAMPPPASARPMNPRMRELIDEIVKLSLQYGVLTEYTAFLAREGTDLSRLPDIVAETGQTLISRAISARSGAGAVNQSANLSRQVTQTVANTRNTFMDANLQSVSITNVQQMSNQALYNRQGRWVESSLAAQTSTVAPKRSIAFGSKEYFDLAEQLARQGRQGVFAVHGDVVITVDNEPVLIMAPVK